MKRLLVLLLLLLLVRASAAAQQSRDERVVARINGAIVTVERFNVSYVQHLIRTGRNDTPQERFAHLQQIVDDFLLADEARRRGLEDAEYRNFIDTEIKKVVGGRFFEIAFADSFPDPDEADVRKAFVRSQEKVVLRQLFFHNPDSAAAAYQRLQQGEDFLKVANDVFETSSFDSSAGWLGEAKYWDLDDRVAEAVYDLDQGEYTPPIRTRFGWHIIRLEDRLRNPLLTEHQFALRSETVANELRARRFRMQGTEFVRAFMDSLDVTVDAQAIESLRETILGAVGAEQEGPLAPNVLQPEEVAAIESEFSESTPLLTYTFDGEQRVFTARDYFRWLPSLPYGEVRHMTAASVGRALRNEVLAMQGFEMGLDDDPRVEEEVAFRAAEYLAGALRSTLRRESDVDPSDAEIAEAYERLGYRTLKIADADFWRIDFPSFAAARQAKDSIAAGADPASFDGYERHTSFDLRELDELGRHMLVAPTGEPVVIGTDGGGWHVVMLENRTVEYVALEEARDEIAEKIRPFVPEVRLLRRLRKEADVYIDYDLIEPAAQARSIDGSR